MKFLKGQLWKILLLVFCFVGGGVIAQASGDGRACFVHSSVCSYTVYGCY
ncbi:MAG: hypothetical protein JWM21_3081 [Acidobacteria bacterium]|nr:hypothetical protein [Acidobacteriota bacterium]